MVKTWLERGAELVEDGAYGVYISDRWLMQAEIKDLRAEIDLLLQQIDILVRDKKSNTIAFLAMRAERDALQVPEGMVLVPSEPTDAMLIAGRIADKSWMVSDCEENGLSVIYKAMLNAAKENP